MSERVTKKVLREIELKAAYEAWTGKEAQEIEAKGNSFHMVIVSRYVNVKGKTILKRSEYPFSTEEIAKKCEAYWLKRGGLANLLVCKVLSEWGYTDEPDLHGGA